MSASSSKVVKLADVSLESAAVSLDTGTFAAKSLLLVYVYVAGMAAAGKRLVCTCNSDTGANYSATYSINGGASATNINQAFLIIGAADVQPQFIAFSVWNTTGIKPRITGTGSTSTDVKTTAPNTYEIGGLWDSTSQVTSIQLKNHLADSNLLAGTRVIIYGLDI